MVAFRSRLQPLLRKCSVLLLMFTMWCLFCAFDSAQNKIYDDADLLTASQEAALQERCVSTAQSSLIDIIIVTTDNVGSKSSMTYSEDFFMAHDFGYDKKHGNAILLLINMDDREVWISTSGSGITYFSDTRIDNMITNITPYLSKADYDGACEYFLKRVATYMQTKPSSSDAGGNGSAQTVHDAASFSEKLLTGLPYKLLISVAAALIITLIISYRAKAHMTVDESTYLADHKYAVHRQHDRFTHTTSIRHQKSSGNGNGGGGGSSHSGSGGHSFGGGGGKF